MFRSPRLLTLVVLFTTVAATLLPGLIGVLVLIAIWTLRAFTRVLCVIVWLGVAAPSLMVIWALFVDPTATLLVLPAVIGALLAALLQYPHAVLEQTPER